MYRNVTSQRLHTSHGVINDLMCQNESYDSPQFISLTVCHRSGRNLSYDTLNFQDLKICMICAINLYSISKPRSTRTPYSDTAPVRGVSWTCDLHIAWLRLAVSCFTQCLEIVKNRTRSTPTPKVLPIVQRVRSPRSNVPSGAQYVSNKSTMLY